MNENVTQITRDQIATYLDTTPNTGTPTLSLVGIGITEYGIDFNPQMSTKKYICNKNATTKLNSYQMQGAVTQECIKGDAVYDFVNKLRRELKIGSEVKTHVYDVDMYDVEGTGTNAKYQATKYECIVVINGYAKGEDPTIEYSIYYNGDPVLGTVSLDDEGIATFTEEQQVIE